MHEGTRLYKARGFIYFHHCYFIAILYIVFWNYKSELIWLISGTVLIGIGEFIRLWGASYIGTVGRAFNLDVKTFISGGPYRFVRNPIYIANFFYLNGVAVLSKTWFLIPYITIWLIILYWKIVPREEKYLLETFGDEYKKYCEKVNRYLPKFKKVENQEKSLYNLKQGVKNELHVLIYQIVFIITMTAVSFFRGGWVWF